MDVGQREPLTSSGSAGGGRLVSRWCPRSPVVRYGLVAAGLAVVSVTIATSVALTSRGRGGTSHTFRGPVVINTWFPDATAVAFGLVNTNYAAMDAVEAGVTYCEMNQCDGTVGWGNHPDSTGETTLDAMVMDGNTMNAGVVAYLRGVGAAVSSARKVMHYSTHTALAGDGASNFSMMMGCPAQNLHSNASLKEYDDWVAAQCQPNFWANVMHGNSTCPPYAPIPTPSPTPVPASTRSLQSSPIAQDDAAMRDPGGAMATPHTAAWTPQQRREHAVAAGLPKPPSPWMDRTNHDTIGMCVLDAGGNLVVGGSTNGANHKIAGRMSDIAMLGAGAYVDGTAGCAAGTGDGDITMRFLPAYQAVEFMRQGMLPQEACEGAVRRIMRVYGIDFHIGLVCMDPWGNTGAAAQGWPAFTYGVAGGEAGPVAKAVSVSPLPLA